MKNTELLSPAGDFECFQSALKFGADAIYLAGEEYGMRTSSANFDHDTLKKSSITCTRKGCCCICYLQYNSTKQGNGNTSKLS